MGGIWPARGTSAPSSGTFFTVSTARTPGSFRARAVSMRVRRAWACGLRTRARCAVPGGAMSST